MKSKNRESEGRAIGAKVMAASLLIATTFGVAVDSQNIVHPATMNSSTLVKKSTTKKSSGLFKKSALIASAPTKNSAVHLISSARVPVNEPASAGIKLLQVILEHIKNMPVIAMVNLKNARKDMVSQQVAPQIAMNNGPAQKQLMIMPPSYTQGYTGTNETNSSKLARGSSLQVADERPIVRDYREAPVLGMRAKRRAAMMPSSTPMPTEKAQDAPEQSGFQQLASNLSKFGGAIQNMQRLQQSVASPQIANATADDKTYAPQAQAPRNMEISTNPQQPKFGVTEYNVGGTIGHGSISQGSNAYNNAYPYGRAMQAPAMQAPSSMDNFTRQAVGTSDLIYGDEGVAATSAASPPPLPSQAGAGGVVVPENPSKYKHLRQSNFGSKDADGVYTQPVAGKLLAKKAKTMERSKVSDVDRREIALLPPNVITGIPLVSLGTSAEQAQRLLAPRGKLSKQTIATASGKWIVWTLSKNGTNEPSMYLYMRHGMIEALRVLDSSFVTPSFGVELGAPLSAVKTKFGEPAFIIGEPCNDPVNGGQNYVYPISQVAFQVARRAPKNEPVLVSILIFNVKDQ